VRFDSFRSSSKRASLVASSIKSNDTNPERVLRSELWRRGLRYRKNVSSLPGKPDIVFRSAMLVVFCDGDFWHGYEWESRKNRIKSNRAYWIEKIEANIRRDLKTTKQLEEMGFRVVRFWEHEIAGRLEECGDVVERMVRSVGSR